MTGLQGKTAVVTGGSRGLGRGMVEALAAGGAAVLAIARDRGALETLEREVDGVRTQAADVADPETAALVVGETRPDILVLNAGATPHMAPVQEQTWEQFARAWETDVKATFHFGKQCLLQPLAPGSTVIVVSSGAAIGGSPLSGGYSGAKRTQWFTARFLHQQSAALGLGIRFVALLPKQLVGVTETGHVAASAYAASQGVSKETFIAQLGKNLDAPELTPEIVGQAVVALIADPAYSDGLAYGVTGRGLELLD